MSTTASSINLQIRDRAELHVPLGDTTAVFAIRVQDFVTDGIVIDRPIIDQQLLPSSPGRKIAIVFQRQDATYRFNSQIIRDGVLDRLPVLIIKPPAEIERIQRREHFRLELDLPIRFLKLLKPGGDAITPSMKGKVINLSAGGVRFSTDLPPEFKLFAGDVLQVGFVLSNNYVVTGLETLILKADIDQRLADRWIFACRYLNITPSIQEAIIVHNIRYQQQYRVEHRGR